MVSEERFKNVFGPAYREKLVFLMKEAQKKKDIWLMLLINDKIKEYDAKQIRDYLTACEKARGVPS